MKRLAFVALIALIGCEKSATEKVNERKLDEMKRQEYIGRLGDAVKSGDKSAQGKVMSDFYKDKDVIHK